VKRHSLADSRRNFVGDVTAIVGGRKPQELQERHPEPAQDLSTCFHFVLEMLKQVQHDVLNLALLSISSRCGTMLCAEVGPPKFIGIPTCSNLMVLSEACSGFRHYLFQSLQENVQCIWGKYYLFHGSLESLHLQNPQTNLCGCEWQDSISSSASFLHYSTFILVWLCCCPPSISFKYCFENSQNTSTRSHTIINFHHRLRSKFVRHVPMKQPSFNRKTLILIHHECISLPQLAH